MCPPPPPPPPPRPRPAPKEFVGRIKTPNLNFVAPPAAPPPL